MHRNMLVRFSNDGYWSEYFRDRIGKIVEVRESGICRVMLLDKNKVTVTIHPIELQMGKVTVIKLWRQDNETI